MQKKLTFELFFDFLRPAFGHGRLGHPQSLDPGVLLYFYKILIFLITFPVFKFSLNEFLNGYRHILKNMGGWVAGQVKLYSHFFGLPLV